jgi:ferredoxin-NADP reductase
MLPSSLSSALGALFVLLAAANVWSMLHATGRSTDPTTRGRLIVLHRISGYVFVALFFAMSYFMALRIKGLQDELPPRQVLHFVLALLLVPILFVKILIARYNRHYSAALLPLGLTIFVLSFALVAINLPHWLTNAAPSDGNIAWSTGVLIVTLVAVGSLLLRRPGSTVRAPQAGEIAPKTVERMAEYTQPPVSRSSRPPKLLRLAYIETQTHDTRTLRFLIREEDRFAARPGQFLKFRWDIDGRRVERCYSLCSSPTQTAYLEITPKRVAEGYVSKFLNDRAAVGLQVEAEGPFGRFTFDERQHKRVVLIAGGSGITPMLSILRYIDDCCVETPVTLIYCVRTRFDIFFETELERLKARLENFHAFQLLSRPDADWRGLSGRISREFVAAHVERLSSTTFFVCGPHPFMERVGEILASLGVESEHIKVESFDTKHVPSAALEFENEDGATIEFARSGKLAVSLSGKNLLEVAELNGIAIPSGCRAGQCGACVTRLLDGEVEMSCEDALDPSQKSQGYVLLCVGRAKGNIRLDA